MTNLLSLLKGWFSSSQPRLSSKTRPPNLAGGRARVSVNDASDLPFSSTLYIVPPPDDETLWRTQTLDSDTLDRMSPADLVELLVNLSPEVSRALFDFIRMFNPGWEILALRPGTEEEDSRGQAAIDAFLATLKELYISEDVVFNRLILAGFLRGAFFSEIVLDEAGRMPVDLATPDPYSARFRKISDPVRGTIYQLGQYQDGGWVDIDTPTVAYIPIDPLPDSPYGRSLVSPALFTSIFIIGLLHDLRRVISQQGYPRLDLSIEMEKLREAMPLNLESDPDATKAWIDAIITEIEQVYAGLAPDDAYIHTDVVSVNSPMGTLNTANLGAIDGIITALERMATRALKTMPLLMVIDESASETHANRQWEVHTAGLKAMQHLLESLLENLLTVGLRAQGIQSEVQFRFAELRASELLRDAQAEAMQIANESAKVSAGWISDEEASIEITGHPPTGEKAAPPPQFVSPQEDEEIVQGDGDGEEPDQNEETDRQKETQTQTNGHVRHT